MTFGWYGFRFEHPDDFAPASFAGDRRKGYVRLQADPFRVIQVRWLPSKDTPAENALDGYIASLRKDAQKSRLPFEVNRRKSDTGLHYTYSGTQKAAGNCFFSEVSMRVFIVESCGKSVSASERALQHLCGHFCDTTATEDWAMLGLHIRLPSDLRVKSFRLLSGRTTLELETFCTHVRLERWALARQILRSHELESWAKATLKMPRAEITDGHSGLRLASSPRWGGKVVGLVQLDPHRNQIHTIRSRFRDTKWEPTWDCFQT